MHFVTHFLAYACSRGFPKHHKIKGFLKEFAALELTVGACHKIPYFDHSPSGFFSFFVDLFVRVSNSVAIKMYELLGYTVYRKVLQYYSGETDEDAFDMRKALSRDPEGKSVVPMEPIEVGVDELYTGNL